LPTASINASISAVEIPILDAASFCSKGVGKFYIFFSSRHYLHAILMIINAVFISA
jgi:hypothetical protein